MTPEIVLSIVAIVLSVIAIGWQIYEHTYRQSKLYFYDSWGKSYSVHNGGRTLTHITPAIIIYNVREEPTFLRTFKITIAEHQPTDYAMSADNAGIVTNTQPLAYSFPFYIDKPEQILSIAFVDAKRQTHSVDMVTINALNREISLIGKPEEASNFLGDSNPHPRPLKT